MIRPTAICAWFFLLGLPIALLPAIVGPGLGPVWFVFLVGFALIAIVDLFRCPRPRLLRFDIEAPTQLYIGARATLLLHVDQHRVAPDTLIDLRLELSDDLEGPDLLRHTIHDLTREPLELPVMPTARGHARVNALWLRWRSPLRLFRRSIELRQDLEIPVIPNVRSVRGAALRFYSSEQQSGLKTERYLGDGSEFDALREFMPGMDHRAIDWKASARHLKLLCRQFRAERNHQIILAYDTGQLMREPLDGVPKLDHAINAGLLLSYVSLRAGDRVGLYSFGARPGVYAEPLGGAATIRRLSQQTAQLDYSHEETNFTLGLTNLSARLRRRSLVILMTDFVDTITAELMLDNLRRLASRHLILFVSLRDPLLEEVAARKPADQTDLNLSVLAGDQIRDRERVLQRLKRLGIQCADTTPEQVSTELLNRYLQIRQREMIG
ncbi:MAG: DUF58 domain-containing protein [Planctomycetota bacterium]